MESYNTDGNYQLHGPWIYALLIGIVQDSDLAEELTLEVFWQARQSARALRPGDVRVWSRVTARRLAISALRSKEWTASYPASFRAACVEARVDLRGVQRVLSATPRHEREAFELAYFENLSHSEIAALTGRSLGTVKTWVRMARIRVERPQSRRTQTQNAPTSGNKSSDPWPEAELQRSA